MMSTPVGPHERRWAATIVTICLMAFGAGGCADNLILYPSTQPIAVDRGIKRQIIPFNGKSLEIWKCSSVAVTAAQSARAYVLSFNGNASRAEWALPDVAARGQWKRA